MRRTGPNSRASAISDEALNSGGRCQHALGRIGIHRPRASRRQADYRYQRHLEPAFRARAVKTVTPCLAHLKVTSRLVANQDNAKIAESDSARTRLNMRRPERRSVFRIWNMGLETLYGGPATSSGERVAHQCPHSIIYGRERRRLPVPVVPCRSLPGSRKFWVSTPSRSASACLARRRTPPTSGTWPASSIAPAAFTRHSSRLWHDLGPRLFWTRATRPTSPTFWSSCAFPASAPIPPMLPMSPAAQTGSWPG